MKEISTLYDKNINSLMKEKQTIKMLKTTLEGVRLVALILIIIMDKLISDIIILTKLIIILLNFNYT